MRKVIFEKKWNWVRVKGAEAGVIKVFNSADGWWAAWRTNFTQADNCGPYKSKKEAYFASAYDLRRDFDNYTRKR